MNTIIKSITVDCVSCKDERLKREWKCYSIIDRSEKHLCFGKTFRLRKREKKERAKNEAENIILYQCIFLQFSPILRRVHCLSALGIWRIMMCPDVQGIVSTEKIYTAITIIARIGIIFSFFIDCLYLQKES